MEPNDSNGLTPVTTLGNILEQSDEDQHSNDTNQIGGYNDDLTNMLINISSQIKSLDARLSIELTSLTKRLAKAEDSLSIIATVVSGSPVARANLVERKNTSQWTRSVMFVVPALYIRCVWEYVNYED